MLPKIAVAQSIFSSQRDTTYDGFSGHFFRIFEIKFVCFDVAIFDQVHDMEAIFPLPLLQTESGNLS